MRFFSLYVGIFLFAKVSAGAMPVVDIGAMQQRYTNLLKEIEHRAKQLQEFARAAKRFEQQTKRLGEGHWEEVFRMNEYINFIANIEQSILEDTKDYRLMARKFDRDYGKIGSGSSYEKKEKLWAEKTSRLLEKTLKINDKLLNSKEKSEKFKRRLSSLKDAEGQVSALQALGSINETMGTQLNELKTIVLLDVRLRQSYLKSEEGQKKIAKEKNRAFFRGMGDLQKDKNYKVKFPKLGERN